MSNEPNGTPRLADVARAAGVSQSTASRVLNGSARQVADGYRERVLAAAAQVGYTTNLAAQAMARGHYPAVALVVGDIRDQFFARIAYGAVQEASRRGYILNLLSTEGDASRERDLVQELRRQRPEALVLVRKRDTTARAGSKLIEQLMGFQRESGRVVIVGEPSEPVLAIRPPDFDGGKALASALLELGYRRFAVFLANEKIPSERDRLDGFRVGLSAGGVALPDSNVYRTAQSVTGGIAAAKLYLADDRDAEVIVATEDEVAWGAAHELQASGLAVPDDIAVAGYGQRRFTAFGDDADWLTTVRSPLEEMGAAAVSAALDPLASDVPMPAPGIHIGGSTPGRSRSAATRGRRDGRRTH
ncbi:LacI family transcriptional regulator [Kribbella aluminosa]|uniref:LacI family transcriptional regulator n=1 Tax=Kribbella aluminosa TaxID=416017 RepID=A0ABS4UFY2_9ACTN|nr:LacI family DNA-binding transcriptional regulator [Kribbella aluminosa]MBP2350535.1 LacI family transcriptional regulator [Kribbella aluminosa]